MVPRLLQVLAVENKNGNMGPGIVSDTSSDGVCKGGIAMKDRVECQETSGLTNFIGPLQVWPMVYI